MAGDAADSKTLPRPPGKRRSAVFQGWLSGASFEEAMQSVASARRTAQPAPGARPAAQWTSAGPENIGGRMTCAVVDPKDPLHLWAGAAGGGVWETRDGGAIWKILWDDHAESLNIGSLAVATDSRGQLVLYCGTGEANLVEDSYSGVGLYRSQDEGVSWQLVARSDATQPDQRVPRRIGALAVAPGEKAIWLGGVQIESTEPLGGLFLSLDQGKSWTRQIFNGTLGLQDPYDCNAVALDPSDPQRVYAAIAAPKTSAGGPSNGIWLSPDQGRTWQHLSTADGLPAGEEIGRVSLAICPSQPAVLYAVIAYPEEVLRGVYRTSDGGKTWEDLTSLGFAAAPGMHYNNAVAVHPSDPDFIVWGGVDLYASWDGGSTWRRATRWEADLGDPDYAHADHHALLIVPTQPEKSVIYDFNDGGLDISSDGSWRWENRSKGLVTTQFYDLEVADSAAEVLGGGTQDNGTLLTRNGGGSRFEMILGGDGGWLAIHPRRADFLFANANESHGVRILRQRQERGQLQITRQSLTQQDTDFWIAPLEIHPADPTVAFIASERVFRTLDEGDVWDPVTGSLDGSPVSAIEISRVRDDRVFVATRNGGVFRSDNWGDAWTGNLSPRFFPTGIEVARLRGSRFDADLVFAAIGGLHHPHLYRSDDAGVTWVPLGAHPDPKKALPDVPHHAVELIEPDRATLHIYVANDAGVYRSLDEGKTWENITGEVPHAGVTDLVYHPASNTLTAATYGRGLWRATL